MRATLFVFVALLTAAPAAAQSTQPAATTQPAGEALVVWVPAEDGATLEPLDGRLIATDELRRARVTVEALRAELAKLRQQVTALRDALDDATVIPPRQTPDAINPNTATLEQLDTLPGVGIDKPTSIGPRIVQFREAAEPPAFRSAEDLARVRGISLEMAQEWADAGLLAFGVVEQEQE